MNREGMTLLRFLSEGGRHVCIDRQRRDSEKGGGDYMPRISTEEKLNGN